MNNLNNLKDEELVELIQKGEISAGDLTDAGLCPTCFNKSHNGVLYGDDTNKLVYEDEDIECFLVGNPRAEGHVAISTRNHFKDMMDIDDAICEKVFKFAKKAMCAIREVYKSESVYLCTMCDGPMNHFHVQLIPRYKDEKRGSKNFVKPRQEFKDDLHKLEELRNKLK